MSAPDPNEVLPGGLSRKQFEDFKDANPIGAARYAQVHGVRDTRPNSGDGAVRLAAIRPDGLAGDQLDVSTLAADDPKAIYAALKKTNPVIAARYAAEQGLK